MQSDHVRGIAHWPRAFVLMSPEAMPMPRFARHCSNLTYGEEDENGTEDRQPRPAPRMMPPATSSTTPGLPRLSLIREAAQHRPDLGGGSARQRSSSGHFFGAPPRQPWLLSSDNAIYRVTSLLSPGSLALVVACAC